jgi:hypothetical protein
MNHKEHEEHKEISFVIPARHRPPEAGSGKAGGFVHFVAKMYPYLVYCNPSPLLLVMFAVR